MEPPLIVTIGDLVEDVVVTSDAPPRLGTDTPARIARRRGGSAANVASAAVRAGAHARFVGLVGADPHGDQLVRALMGEGVDPCVVRAGRSGSVVVLVYDGERTFLTDRGSSPDLDHVPGGALDGAAWVHAPAYSLAGRALRTTTLDVLTTARGLEVPVSIDASSVALLENFGAEAFIAECSAIGCGVLFANEDEAGLLGLLEPGRGLAAGIPIVVVKQGANPTIVLTATERIEVAPEPIEGPFDPTGAGDAFAAGFVVAYLGGASLEEAAVAGNRMAHDVLTTPRSSW